MASPDMAAQLTEETHSDKAYWYVVSMVSKKVTSLMQANKQWQAVLNLFEQNYIYLLCRHYN